MFRNLQTWGDYLELFTYRKYGKFYVTQVNRLLVHLRLAHKKHVDIGLTLFYEKHFKGKIKIK